MKHLIDIPNEFKVNKNELYIESSDLDFEEDILQIELESKNLSIDLGWYRKEVSKDGIYKLFLISHHNWEEPVILIESRSKKEITNKLEILISTISSGEFTINLS